MEDTLAFDHDDDLDSARHQQPSDCYQSGLFVLRPQTDMAAKNSPKMRQFKKKGSLTLTLVQPDIVSRLTFVVGLS
jgi:hypothetical protein